MINKDTNIFCSFSNNPGNNGCKFFNNEFELHNVNAIYKSFYSDNIEESIRAVKTLDIKGFAVSMPFKIEILKHLDIIVDDARKIGAVNTVLNYDGKLWGYNTDWVGVKKYLEQTDYKYIYILGNGGFSKAVQYACKSLDIHYSIITRDIWHLLDDIKNCILFNATPIDIDSKNNFLIDGRSHTIEGKLIATYQAQCQFEMYTGEDYD